jgi:cell wall-associated NlpC family hydrolase
MDPKALAGIAGATLVLVIGSATGLGLAGGGLAAAACAHPPTPTPTGGSSTAAPTTAVSATGWRPVGAWTGQQVANAATIVAVGQRLSVPPRGWVIAVATAMQESRLTNLPGGDRDSLGLFQQRPSAGWGDTPTGPGDHRTPTQRILDPTYAATRFYTALVGVPGWQNLPLTVAAQAVQRSGSPDAYAKQESDALALVEAVGPALAGLPAGVYAQWVSVCVALGGDGQPTGTPAALPAGFTLPAATPPAVRAAIGWALAQLGTPYSYGGDCTDPHGPDPAHHCDCSSLTQMAWKAGGITIPRTAAEQSRIGTPVPDLAQLRPGDLVFIPGAEGSAIAPGHVALFVGAGLVVEAPHTGDCVKLVPVQQWAPMITQLRRLVT